MSEPDEPRGLVTCGGGTKTDLGNPDLRHTESLRRPEVYLSQQQEVIEQEAVELLAALGFEQLPAVEELPGTQTVGDGVKHQLLMDGEEKVIISFY